MELGQAAAKRYSLANQFAAHSWRLGDTEAAAAAAQQQDSTEPDPRLTDPRCCWPATRRLSAGFQDHNNNNQNHNHNLQDTLEDFGAGQWAAQEPAAKRLRPLPVPDAGSMCEYPLRPHNSAGQPAYLEEEQVAPADAGPQVAMLNQGQQQQQPLQRQQWPLNHPLANTKHLCSICGDRATGKHYGVFSCEGCKGFFKRTIRKDIVYACRADGGCLIDMRQRNRCQFCRYQKCLRQGMKREAVQEEKQRLKLRALAASDHNIQQQHQLTLSQQQQENQQHLFRPVGVDSPLPAAAASYSTPQPHSHQPLDEFALRWAAHGQVEALVEWVRSVPRFSELLLEDRITLLRAHWNELIISELAFKTAQSLPADAHLLPATRSLCLGRNLFIEEHQAHLVGLGGDLFERIFEELVLRMHLMRLDANELACLRAIILFNPETHALKSSQPIEEHRGQVYQALELYCRDAHPHQPNRFGKLLLRLPALRSIGLKCHSPALSGASDAPGLLQPLPAGRAADSPSLSTTSSSTSTSTSPNHHYQHQQPPVPAAKKPAHQYHQVQLLFFELCHDPALLDSFLRSNLMFQHASNQ